MNVAHDPLSTVPPSRTYRNGSTRIELFKRGLRRYQKATYPSYCGIYHSFATSRATMHFNLNHEIIRLAGRGRDWPHPQEWLKRTIANDWVYYSTGGYTGVYETTGEFYLPNLPYRTNNHLGGEPLRSRAVADQVESWRDHLSAVRDSDAHLPRDPAAIIDRILAQSPDELSSKREALHRISQGPISVLPPDTRHVDYQVVPLTVAEGCLYKCGFCRVKNSRTFKESSFAQIDAQIEQLEQLLADDLINFNALFLGQHDALNANSGLIFYAIEQAQTKLNLASSYIGGSSIFLFGSVDSLLGARESLFEDLDQLPGTMFINIGLESADQATLDMLEKPVRAADVEAAFDRAQQINRRYRTIEVSLNFVTDPDLSKAHYDALLDLIRERVNGKKDKGCVYLSPLRFGEPSRARLFDFYRLKRLSRLPLFMYTIQRL
jgi:hypothetical protein